MGQPSVVSKNVEPADPPASLEDYLPAYPDKDVLAARFDEIREFVESKEGPDKTCSRLLAAVYGGAFFVKFSKAPGSVTPHYGCEGGLMASVVRVADTCTRLFQAYGLSDQESVVLLTAALLHRIGGVDAYEFADCMPTETENGVLIGVKNLTLLRVKSAAQRVKAATEKDAASPAVDDGVVRRIIHCVVSHDEVGVLPMTKEALILHAAWKADSEVVEAVDFISNDQNAGSPFTAWDPARRRRYYRG
jgi:23S rRNA maturation-related 3'-5' exoribonuclease YhaM